MKMARSSGMSAWVLIVEGTTTMTGGLGDDVMSRAGAALRCTARPRYGKGTVTSSRLLPPPVPRRDHYSGTLI